MIGLPEGTRACLFDLDGVLTSTAAVHRAAWKQTFDAFLREREGANFAEFTDADYAAYVDGLPRYDGVRNFLAARDIVLPEGSATDASERLTVQGVGNRKNDLLVAAIESEGVTAFPGSLRYLQAVRTAGLAIGVVTSSANASAILDAASLTEFVQALVDGVRIRRDGLAGKPAPDSFTTCAADLNAAPARAVVFEDALAGVQAAHAGGFGYIVGVNRADQADALRAQGANVVVHDLAELLEEQS